MQKFFINPNLFFLIENDGNVLVWDYKHHRQFLIDEKYFSELLEISKNGNTLERDILKEFKEAQLVSSTQQKNSDWGWDIISHIFHVGTQDVYVSEPSNNDLELAQNYIDECSNLDPKRPALFIEKPGKLINLPTPNINLLEQSNFFSLLKNRKTCRKFNGKAISLNELSLLLYASFGLIHGNEWEEFEAHGLETVGMRKASPASGALHAEEVYILAYQVSELEQGVYHYRPQDHKLTQLILGDFEKKVIEANYDQFFSSGLAFGLYLTCRLDKLWWKYKHSRSLKVALLDLGHASQTFQLCATALKLQTWVTAAFQDKIVNELIQVDGLKESAFLFLGVGYGTNQAIPDTMLHLFG